MFRESLVLEFFTYSSPMGLVILTNEVHSAKKTSGLIGQPCLSNEKRRCIPENAECIDEICMCASFYKAIDGACVTEKSKTLKQHCRGGGDCHGPGEFCSSFSICMCLSTHVDVGSQCKPVIYPGQHGCEDSIQCNKGFPGANCDVHRNCVCPVGLVAIQQTCVSNEHAHHPPIRNEVMLQNEIMADHRTINRSEFRGNFFRRRNYDGGPRAFQIGPDLTCSYDNQCAGYPLAICDSVCKCVKGALNTGTTCIATSTALQSTVACPAGQTYIREAGVCMTVQQPGEPCQYSQQCSALEPGAYCLKMRCECVYGMKKSSNGCTFVNNDCKERGHIFISEIGECREVIPPGGKGCSHNLQCSGAYPDATCFMQTCTCPPNLPVAADGTCGRSCPDKQVYSGVTGECLPGCPSGLVEVGGRCVKQVSIGQPCTANAQCNFGSFCQSGTCQCPPGFYVMDSQCEAIESDPNGSCQNNEKCTKGSVCYNGKCTCPRNQELVNGYCQQNRAAALAYNNALNNIRKIRLRFASQAKSRNAVNDPQLTDVESNNSSVPIGSACVRVGVTCDGGSVCVAGICVCPLGKTPRNGVCIEQVAARPGASCRSGEECVDHSYCSEETGKCECTRASQMVIGGECRERLKAHPGYGCTMGEMCVGNSVCLNGKCACVDGKVDINKICVDPVSAKPGDTCGKGIVCQGGSYCNTDSGKCACPRGENAINGVCKAFTFVYPGDLCTEVTSRCAGGSYCARGRCECPLNMNAIDKKCVLQQTAAPGEACSENVVCSGFSVCKNNRCSCVNDMMIRERMCVQRRKVNIGSSCSVEDQCLGNSTCTDSTCQCQTGHVASSNICVLRKTVTPGYLCSPEDICTGQSVCMKGVCQCPSDYKQMHNICVKKTIGVEGSPCSTRDDCGEGLTCNTGRCSCPEGLFSVIGRCRSYIQLGQTCLTDDRCAERNAQCQENVCSCKSGYVNINGQCAANIVTPAEPESLSQVKSGLIGHICTTNDHCKILHSHCRRNVCICKDGYRIFGSTQCIPRVAKPKERKVEKISQLVELGEKCDKLSLCQRGAVCNEGVCSCPETFYEINGVCVKNIAKIKVVVPPLSSCLNGEECSGNSECVHGMCFCKEEYTLYQGKCQRLKIVEKLRVLETKKIINPHKSFTSATSTPKPTTTSTKTTTTSTETPTTASTKAITTSPQPITTTEKAPLTPIKISMKLGTTTSSSLVTPNPNYEYKWRLSKPGHACDNMSFCISCSTCVNGFCRCPEGLELYGEECVSQIEATKCLASNQCPSGAQCVKGECKCKPGLAISRYGFCVPITFAEPGTSCSYGERCQKDSHCEDGLCTCNEPLILKENKCIRSPREKRFVSDPHRKLLRFTPKKKAKLGEYCFRDDHCESQKQCLKNVCKCGRNFVQSSFSCVPRMSVVSSLAMPGESCRKGFCVGGSTCTNFICKCPDDYFKQGDSCIRYESRIGAPCGTATGCSGGATCSSSFCQCQDQYDADVDECYPYEPPVRSKNIKAIGGRRKVNRVVSASTINCPIGYDLVNGMCVNSETLSVIQLAAPGGACEDGTILCTGNSVCANNVCICPGGETVQNGTCVAINTYSAPGELCDLTNTVCTGNSQCMDGICKCPNNQGAINGRCSNMGNSNCGNIQCGTNQICIQDTCQCRPGYYQQPGSCLADRCNCIQEVDMSNFDGCNTRQCGMNQICIQDRCQCRTGYLVLQETCVSDKCNCVQPSVDSISVGGCLNQCGTNQVCVQDQCQCRNGYYAQPETCMGDRCNCVLQQVPETNGCQRQCGNNQICIQDQCQCQNGYTVQPESCIADRCNCVQRVVAQPAPCVGSGCSISSSFSPFFGLPGQMCDLRPNSTPCRNDAQCINNYCACPSNRVISGTDCVFYLGDALPGQSCQNSGVICRGGSSCSQNTCQCASGFSPSNGRCSPTVEIRFTMVPVTTAIPVIVIELSPGQTCDPNCSFQPCLQRCSGGSTCTNSVCSCPQGNNIYNNMCVPNFPQNDNSNFTRTARPGENCDNTIVCIGGSSCVIGTCSCDSGYTPSTGKFPPHNYDPKQVPQMVMLSFDDPITDRIINTLKSLFSGKIRNPNGCAIKGTFFVSHQWNNYDQTLWLHSKGNEISVNSITKEDLSGRTKERWYKEQKGMRETLAEFSYVDRSQIIGTRAPLSKIGGDAQFEMMTENNFTYDNSMLVAGAYWPQTLDHKLPWECEGRCPTQSHKGIWEIPIQNIQGDDSRWYKTLTRVLKPVDSRDSVKKILMRNFLNHYKTNRAPFVLTLDTEFLTYLPDNGAIYALEDFLKDIVQKQDVFVVTGTQMIDWMRNPVDLNGLKNLRSWQCKFLMNDHVQPCEVPSTCSFDGRARGQYAHSFRMCGVCPTSYPWI
uniref:EGF-like domain-containing protein n=2 Tax=Caenorhabditis tropicalis TaxID=1561998 RepID=A0A1I7TWD6_9PELO